MHVLCSSSASPWGGQEKAGTDEELWIVNGGDMLFEAEQFRLGIQETEVG